jgi:hypothetical protein
VRVKRSDTIRRRKKKRISKFENWAKNIRQTKMGKKRDRKNERDASGVFLNGFHG